MQYASWVPAALGPLFTSCLWSPVLSPDSFWVGKFHAWFCQPTSCRPKSTGCNFPLPSPEYFMLLVSLTLWWLPRPSLWLYSLKEASWALPGLPHWLTLVSPLPIPTRFHFTKSKFGKPQWAALHRQFKAVPYQLLLSFAWYLGKHLGFLFLGKLFSWNVIFRAQNSIYCLL